MRDGKEPKTCTSTSASVVWKSMAETSVSSPQGVQTILNGTSPLDTRSDIWANAPTFFADSSNLNGKSNGSYNKN